MYVFTTAHHYLIRFDSDENVWDLLIEFCKQTALTTATFQAIGASKQITLSYYDLSKKEYLDTTITEDLEILTISGNISLLDKKHIIHAHGTFGKKDLSVIGGHIKKLVISATCELVLIPLKTPLTRRFDEKTGLNLLSSS